MLREAFFRGHGVHNVRSTAMRAKNEMQDLSRSISAVVSVSLSPALLIHFLHHPGFRQGHRHLRHVGCNVEV